MIDFLGIGAQKSGTTALDYYLRQHPQIGMGRQKELHFFDNEELFNTSAVDYDLFETLFDKRNGIRIYGEVTPIYMYWEPSIRRIWDYNPAMKLICILRNPSTRAFSQWNMITDKGIEKEDFLYSIASESERAKSFLPLQSRQTSYTDRGLYAAQIRRIWRFFPKEQVLFIKYEEFLNQQQEWLFKIFDFLKVDKSVYNFTKQEVHKREYNERKMSVEEKKYLAELFKNDICEVERLLDWNCEDWKN